MSAPDQPENPAFTAIVHYSAAPTIGGVEAVMQAHAQVFLRSGYPVTIVAGRGEAQALPDGAGFIRVPEMDSQHPAIAAMSARLEQGEVPPDFKALASRLAEKLAPVISQFEHVIVHNIFFKHFNLPLTAALYELLDAGRLRGCIAWGHDFSWTSPNSRPKVHPGYPWDLLRTYRGEIAYVAVSKQRQRELAELLDRPPEDIRVVYNGVDPQDVLGVSTGSWELYCRLGMLNSNPVLLMPVRVTQAKNIEFAMRLAAALKAQGYLPGVVVTGPPDPHDAGNMAYFGSLLQMRRELGLGEEVRFVFESGPRPGQPYFIESRVVGDLVRLSDAVLMPSHREGFGMPVLEAGLCGVPVFSTDIPAASEIGREEVVRIDPAQDPKSVAAVLLASLEGSPLSRLRRRVRQRYTWQSIFANDIEPLLKQRE